MPDTAIVPARKQSLMDMVRTTQQLADLVASAETPEELALIADQLDGIDIPAKVDGIGFYKKEKEAHILYLKDAAAAVQAQVHAEQAKLERLLSWTHCALKASGAPELKGNVFTIGKRTGEQPLEITDPAKVPDGYRTVTVEMPLSVWQAIRDDLPRSQRECTRTTWSLFDRPAIRADLEAKRPVPGAELLPAEDVLVVRCNARKPRKKEVPASAELQIALK